MAPGAPRRWPNRCGGSGRSGGARWIVIQPGARWPNKRWPAESYAELVRLLAAANPDLQFAILGGEEDRPLGEVIARANAARCLDLTGEISLPEMVEWIRLSKLMVTNDTGPMHVAAALGKPVVALFGPTEPRRTGPYGQLEHVLRIEPPLCSLHEPSLRIRQTVGVPPGHPARRGPRRRPPAPGLPVRLWRSERTARFIKPDFYSLPLWPAPPKVIA